MDPIDRNKDLDSFIAELQEKRASRYQVIISKEEVLDYYIDYQLKQEIIIDRSEAELNFKTLGNYYVEYFFYLAGQKVINKMLESTLWRIKRIGEKLASAQGDELIKVRNEEKKLDEWMNYLDKGVYKIFLLYANQLVLEKIVNDE